MQSPAVLPFPGDGALQFEPPRLLVVPGRAGLEGGQLWGLGSAGHACPELLLPQICLARGETVSPLSVALVCVLDFIYDNAFWELQLPHIRLT